MQTKLIAGLLAGLFATGVAISQTAAPAADSGKQQRHGQHFTKADKNGDGFISREEAAAKPRLAKHFDAIDTSKDGRLSQEELQASRSAMHAKYKQAMEAKFKAADTDGDGALNRAEAEAAALAGVVRMFDKADANKDGKVTLEEMQVVRKSHGRHHGKHHKRGAQHFKMADTDSDGAVSRQEAETAAKTFVAKKFDKLDANKDGKLTREEMKAGKRGHRKADAKT